MGLGVLRIRRGNEAFALARELNVFINGKFAGALAWNQTKEFSVVSGRHLIRVKMDWCRSEPRLFQIAGRDLVELDSDILKLRVTIPDPPTRIFKAFFGASRYFELLEE
ncbi:MAG: hypothetical protein NVSMB14_17880 [Isosphaeraceae bacterium]